MDGSTGYHLSKIRDKKRKDKHTTSLIFENETDLKVQTTVRWLLT